MRYYLGVDGGGSKTTALICDENGARVSSFSAGGINYNAIGMDAARENLRAAVKGALGGRISPFPLLISAAPRWTGLLTLRSPNGSAAA